MSLYTKLRGFALGLAAAASASFLIGVTAQAEPPAQASLLSPALGEAFGPLADASDLPPGCANHWKEPNVRDRTINRETYLHEMSANCVPYGPIDGNLPAPSTFRLYFADPYEPAWCYGYSVNLARKGYVLCDALS
jgi:hypothetical protein